MESSSSTDEEYFLYITQKSGCSGLTLRDWLKFTSNLAIPLIIGVFTIFISIHQQNVAQINRDKDTAQAAEQRQNDTEQARQRREEDIETARLQREEDRNLSRLQSEEDQKAARLQLKEDRENACFQRADDKETARLQRELDLKLATNKRIQEYELAETQRSLYQIQRTHEVEITKENYLSDLILEKDRLNDNILVEYQRELSAFLSDFRTKLDESDFTFLFVLQMRIRATLQSLDAARRTILIKTLFQANLLRDKWKKEISILYKANVSGVQFGQQFNYHTYALPDIEHADVRYASFRFVSLRHLPSFAYSNLDYTDWSFANLSSIDFHKGMTMNHAIFTGSQLTKMGFDTISMNQISFQYNKYCSGCIFLETSMLGARLDHSNFTESIFAALSMADGNISNGSIMDSTFEKVILDRIDFSGADLRRCTFSHVSMVNCSMFGVRFEQAKFLQVNLTGCIGLRIEQMYSLLTTNEVTLPNGTLFLPLTIT